MDCSLPGSSAHGIFQARVLEWGAIAFTEINASLLQFIITGAPPYRYRRCHQCTHYGYPSLKPTVLPKWTLTIAAPGPAHLEASAPSTLWAL